MKEILGKNKKFIGLTGILVVIISIASMITPIIIQYFSEKGVSVSYRVLVLVMVSMTISFAFQVVILIYRENYAAKFNVHYLFDLIKKLTKMNYDSFIELEPSYLVNRIFTAVDALYLFLTTSFSAIIKAGFVIIVSLIIVFLISWKIFLLLLFLLPLNYFGFRQINKSLSLKMSTMQKDAAAANKDLVVTLSNIDNIKSQSSNDALEKLLRPSMQKMYDRLADTNKYAQVSSSAVHFINQIIQNFTYIWASILIIQNEFPVENLIILSIVIPMYYSSLSELAKANIDYKSLSVSNEFIKNDLTANIEANGDKIVVSIDSIDMNRPKFFLGDKEFYFDVQCKLEKNDIVYIEGSSGSGKSSLLKLLLKFRASDGIAVNNIAINEIDNSSLRSKIAYLSQDPTILSTTIENNIGMGKTLTVDEKKWIEDSGILSPILQEKNWNSMLLENGANLSGGEKQRIAICRIILSDADLFILDESISNIDNRSSEKIMAVLIKYAKNKIILFTSHDKEYKKYANKIIKINSGG